LFASLSEFDLAGMIAAAIRRRRRPARYLPGGGEVARGYVLFNETHTSAQTETTARDLEALWD
jgi:hypothetical protein